jgi:hypothetical protein
MQEISEKAEQHVSDELGLNLDLSIIGPSANKQKGLDKKSN